MTETAPRRTEYMPLDQLTPDPANPKAHDMESLDASVGRFGFVESITVDERTGHIVAGHGRHRALVEMRERGDSPPEGVTVSSEGAWLVPVLRGWSSRTDAEARAYLIASNRVSELGGWVDDALLDALDSLDGELSGVGFDEDSLDDLRAKLQETETTGDLLPAEEENTRDSPTLTELRETYTEQGRRLIVLDYPVPEYPEVSARLRALRERYGVDSNPVAVAAVLAEMFPQVTADPAASPDAGDSLGLDGSDPAATIAPDDGGDDGES